MPAIEFIDVRLTMRPGDVVAEFDFCVEAGEWVVFVGPNRSGKSLILKLAAGQLVPESGTIYVLGDEPSRQIEAGPSAWRRRIGVVLQQPGLLSNLTVFNNVALPLRYHGQSAERDIRQAVMAQLEAFNVAALRDVFPAELNRGEARCVSMARALAMGCEVLLLDDPAEGLDAEAIERVGRVLHAYRVARKATVLTTAGTPSGLLMSADRLGFVRKGHLEVLGARADLMAAPVPSLQAYVGGVR